MKRLTAREKKRLKRGYFGRMKKLKRKQNQEGDRTSFREKADACASWGCVGILMAAIFGAGIYGWTKTLSKALPAKAEQAAVVEDK